VKIYWHGRRKPTPRELAAIRLAVRRGQLKNGAHIAPIASWAQSVPPRVRANPSTDAEAAYTEFHWGRGPRRNRRVTLPDYAEGVYELGQLVAVEYHAKKGCERAAVWRHEFSKPRPSLTATPRGKLGPIVGGRAHVTRRGIED